MNCAYKLWKEPLFSWIIFGDAGMVFLKGLMRAFAVWLLFAIAPIALCQTGAAGNSAVGSLHYPSARTANGKQLNSQLDHLETQHATPRHAVRKPAHRMTASGIREEHARPMKFSSRVTPLGTRASAPPHSRKPVVAR